MGTASETDIASDTQAGLARHTGGVVIVLTYNYLYQMYVGTDGLMYSAIEAKQLVDSGNARYAKRGKNS